MSSNRIAIALSCVALFAALTGGAYAASQIGSKDIKTNAVKAKQIKDGAVGTAELADNSVTKNKLANDAIDGGELAEGAVGTPDLADGSVSTAKLADGAVTGAKAGAGVLRDMVIVEDRTPDEGFASAADLQAYATCPTGYVLSGGGGRLVGDDGDIDVTLTASEPGAVGASGYTQWFVKADDTTGVASMEDYAVEARAICVKP